MVREDGILQLTQISVTGEDLSEYASTFGSWDFGGSFLPTGQIDIGVIVPEGESLTWDDRLEFVLGGAVRCTVTKAKKQEIEDANAAELKALDAGTLENERKTKEAFIKFAPGAHRTRRRHHPADV